MHRLHKLWRLSMANRCLLFEAFVLTGLARIAILTLPFRWISPWIGRHTETSGETSEASDGPVKQRVGWAIRVVSARTPWQSKCLVQAITARMMLGRRDVRGTIYLGLRKDPDGTMKAHAWLRSGDSIVTGQGGMESYTVLSSFAFGGVNPSDHVSHCSRPLARSG